MALVVLSCLNFIGNNFVRLYRDSCPLSACIEKNLAKVVKLCAAVLILKMEENMQHLRCIMYYYFRKGKNEIET